MCTVLLSIYIINLLHKFIPVTHPIHIRDCEPARKVGKVRMKEDTQR